MSDTSVPPKHALRSAAHWYAILCCEDVSEQQKQQHAEWMAADATHRAAWQQVEKLRHQFHSLSGSPAMQTLQSKQHHVHKRRTVLRAFSLLAGGSALGGLAWHQAPVNHLLASWNAGYKTGAGERRELSLSDGTRVMLNTATAMDILETATTLLIRLYSGEIFVSTSKKEQGHRTGNVKALQVHTEQGIIVPLGTVFVVRQHSGSTNVTVMEDQVEMIPLSAKGPPQLVNAGEQVTIDRFGVSVSQASPQADSWTQGLLVAVDWPLSQLIAELDRYRTGVLRCDPAVGGLRVSGTYPLDDTDRALRAIANALPVKIARVSNYWVTVTER